MLKDYDSQVLKAFLEMGDRRPTYEAGLELADSMAALGALQKCQLDALIAMTSLGAKGLFERCEAELELRR